MFTEQDQIIDWKWFQILNSECSKDKIWDVMTRLMDLYNHDAMFISPYAEDPNKDAVHSNFEWCGILIFF